MEADKKLATSSDKSELALLSPARRSRYGRTQKPKITEDFYDIDVIFETPHVKKSCRLPRGYSASKTGRSRNTSPRKSRSVRVPFQHVTGDLVIADDAVQEDNIDTDIKPIHDFFNSDSGMLSLQSPVKNVCQESKLKILQDAEKQKPEQLLTEDAIKFESEEVSQVLKIISVNPTEQLDLDNSGGSKPKLKTYSNKRKKGDKNSVVESFGLPDTSIFPLNEKSQSNEPKRIKSLDVSPPSSENDINIVDKKLLNAPWKIANLSVAQETTDDGLLDSSCDVEFLCLPSSQEMEILTPKKEMVATKEKPLDCTTDNQQKVSSARSAKRQRLSLKKPNKKYDKSQMQMKKAVVMLNNCHTTLNTVKNEEKNNKQSNKTECVESIYNNLKALLERTQKSFAKQPKTVEVKEVSKPKNDKNPSLEITKTKKTTPKPSGSTVNNRSLKMELDKLPPASPSKRRSKTVSKIQSNNKEIRQTASEKLNTYSANKQAERVLTTTKKQIETKNKNKSSSLDKESKNVSKQQSPSRKSKNKSTVVKCKPLPLENPTAKSTIEIDSPKTKQRRSRSMANNKSSSDTPQLKGKHKSSNNTYLNKFPHNSHPTESNCNKELKKEPIIQPDETPNTNNSISKKGRTTKSESTRIRSKKNNGQLSTLKTEPEIEIKTEIPDENMPNKEVSKKRKFSEMIAEDYAPDIPMEEVSIKMETKDGIENSNYVHLLESLDIKIGDIMWARIGKYPYWPCMIVEDPINKQFKRCFSQRVSYHLRFFGDNGRRSWLSFTYLMPFTGRNDFSLIRHLLTGSDKKACVVQKRNQKWWEKAVEEAEYLKLKSLRERLNFFDNLLTMKPIKKGKSSLIKSEIKSEPEDLLPPESPPKPVEKSPKKSKTKRKRTPKVKMEHFNPFSDLFSNELINEMNSECSFSDTDSLSKWSSTASSANVFEIEASRQRKNNLFRGVSRDKACQICKKTDKVIKCTGPCNGYFHHKCANLQFPFNAVTVKEKTEKRTINLLKKEIKQELITEFVPDTTDDNVEIVTSVREEKNENKSDVIYIDCDEVAVEHSLTPKGEQLSVKEFNHLSLSDKIDMKMKQIMQKFEEKNTIYADSTTDYTSSEEGTSTMSTRVKSSSKRRTLKVEHVTADCVTFGSENSEDLALTELKPAENETPPVPHITGDSTPRSGSSVDFDCKDFKCGYCAATIEPPCFICGFEVSHKKVALRQKCSLRKCGKFYHPHCVKMWPQTQWSLISTEKHRNSDVQLDTFVCPAHVCHTCASEDPRAGISRCNNSKVVKCIKCPATYHTTNYCVPAGSLILSTSQMICPRHNEVTIDGKGKSLKAGTINTTWCFICSKGGALICCETCPTSVHSECVTLNLLEDGTFICEDCESGRFPLYDDIVWVKFGRYRWWPAAVLFPNEIPARVMAWKRTVGQFVVRFYGTHNYYWADKGKVFLFQDGDNSRQSCNSKVAQCFKKAVDEALAAHQLRKVFKSNQEAEIRHSMKPPHYIRVKVNKPVGNVKLFDANISYTTACECNPLDDTPCGPDSVCLNRLLLTECDPNVCPAKEKCNNQRFEKRQYPPLRPFKTQGRGWGLKTLASIPKGSFVIEYVGEIIDEREYQRRIRKMHEQKDENYYFLTIDKDRIIDAGPKGNLARFMNHSCQPNCETQKWTVNGDTRVGLFAMDDIPADSEVTFNYNLECISKERKICRCGASTCSGFIGVKIKQDESQKKSKKSRITFKKKTSLSKVTSPKNENPCFVCGKMGVVGMCHNKICTKVYHLRCVQLKSWPEGKWVCPWHSCNICNKRTIRCCVKCVNSYCPSHSEGIVRHDKLLGFVCFEHDPTKESQIMPDASLNAKKCSSETTEETDVTSTTCEDEHNSFLKTSKGNEDNFSTIKNPNRSLISTSVKDTDLASFACNLEAYENDRIIDQFKIPNVTPINLQSKRRSKRSLKNRVSADNTSEETALFNSNSTQSYCSSNLIDIVNKKQIKLSPSVPIRHLRTTRQNSNSKQLYSPNSDLEKDLPMRKRSKPRSEAIV